MARSELPIAGAPHPDEVIATALRERDIPRAVFDFIEYNLGRGAAVTACLAGKMRHHDHIPGEPCNCS